MIATCPCKTLEGIRVPDHLFLFQGVWLSKYSMSKGRSMREILRETHAILKWNSVKIYHLPQNKYLIL
jgi:hypothetical protein